MLFRRSLITTLVWLLTFPLTAGEAWVVSQNPEFATPRLVFQPDVAFSGQKTPEESAFAVVSQFAHQIGLDPAHISSQLAITQVRESLTATHVHLQQLIGGLPILDREFIVSLDHDNRRVLRFFNHLVPSQYLQHDQRAKIWISDDDALDLAWAELGVYGRLISLPQADRAFLFQDNALVPVLVCNVHTDGPLGNWELLVEGETGEIVRVRDQNIYRVNASTQDEKTPISRSQAAKEWHQVQVTRDDQPAKQASGTALVFDPDPRTTLNDISLADNSAASRFEDAYRTRTLQGITQSGNSYRLDGSYVTITDFESPSTAPSNTSDGNWTAKRGDNAFNDAMTYFHLDQSQRYLQALGFSGSKGILDGGVHVDTDGLNGADNSYFSSNRAGLGPVLSFGHGCVDDNEDADVILHEYGHAIHWGINSNWSGGDSGAIGEGFGDYWGGSYSYIQPNGRTFFPEWIYSWDGHNNCWSGRLMNKTNLVYSSTRTYQAHEGISGGISDELWSTPLFMALVNLAEQGVPAWQVDQIVIESHFGLGFGVRMPELAAATVDAAQRLQPNGPHATVFQESFARHQILDPVSEFSYVSAHVPPAGDLATAWLSEIQLTNPNDQSLSIVAETYGNDGHEVTSDDFALIATETLNLAAGASTPFVPQGEGQRWVKFRAARPFAGSTTFKRTAVPERGEERVVMPLFDRHQQTAVITYPHVPANRGKFWSGFVLLNPSTQTRNVQIELVGEQGSNLTSLLNGSSSTSLKPLQKWVAFLADSLFDDTASAEKVSFVRMTGDGDLVGFQLYGLQDDQGAAATSGIQAASDFNPSWYVMHPALSHVDWAGFSMLNARDQATLTTVRAFNSSGDELAQKAITLPGKTKWLGLNTLSEGFTFPYANGLPAEIAIAAGQDLSTIIVESSQPLKLFELAGDNGNAVLDGAASQGGHSRVVFNQPAGELYIVNGDLEGDVQIISRDASGTESFAFSFTESLAAWASYQVDVSDWNVASIEIRGANFGAYLVDRDPVNDSLAIIAPSQVEGLVQ